MSVVRDLIRRNSQKLRKPSSGPLHGEKTTESDALGLLALRPAWARSTRGGGHLRFRERGGERPNERGKYGESREGWASRFSEEKGEPQVTQQRDVRVRVVNPSAKFAADSALSASPTCHWSAVFTFRVAALTFHQGRPTLLGNEFGDCRRRGDLLQLELGPICLHSCRMHQGRVNLRAVTSRRS